MCEHCGCETFRPIAELHRDHVTIMEMATVLRSALTRGGTDSAAHLVQELIALLELHGEKEELGLYPTLSGAGVPYVGALEHDHKQVADLLSTPVTDGRFRGRVFAGLDALEGHVVLEEQDLFPYAIQMLDNDQWEGVEAVHRRLDARALAPVRR